MLAVLGLAWILGAPELAARVTLEPLPPRIDAGKDVRLRARVTNTGSRDWKDEQVALSYHRVDPELGTVLVWEGARSQRMTAAPGQSATVEVVVPAVRSPHVRLLLDVVAEGKAWFSNAGTPAVAVDYVTSDPAPPPPVANAPRWTIPNAPATNALQGLVWGTLSRHLRRFAVGDRQVCGYGAGESYPEIWIRDNATIMPAAVFVAPRECLTSWIVAHLALQHDDGSLFDRFSAKDPPDRNSITSDQEPSIVHAAYTVSQKLGHAWLREQVNGESVLRRLVRAMRFALPPDRKPFLVTSGHTGDWGDVGLHHADNRATDLDEASPRVFGIYHQAMAHRGLIELASLAKALADDEAAKDLTAQAARLRQAANETLWREERGYYAVHVHAGDAPKHAFDEDAIFALGGNAVAVLAGLATQSQAQRIFAEAKRRRAIFNATTISAVLLPPYPAGTFEHPGMGIPFYYQNGPEWDWFGLRMVAAMADADDPAATMELERIARQAQHNGTFSEWTTLSGEPRGSRDYVGTAASFVVAVQAVVRAEQRRGAKATFVH